MHIPLSNTHQRIYWRMRASLPPPLTLCFSCGLKPAALTASISCRPQCLENREVIKSSFLIQNRKGTIMGIVFNLYKSVKTFLWQTHFKIVKLTAIHNGLKQTISGSYIIKRRCHHENWSMFKDIFYCRILQRDLLRNMQCGVMYRTAQTDTHLNWEKKIIQYLKGSFN